MKASEIVPGAVLIVLRRGSGNSLYGSPHKGMEMRVRVTGRCRGTPFRRSAMWAGVNLDTGREVKFHPCRAIGPAATEGGAK